MGDAGAAPPPSGPLLVELIASDAFQNVLHDYRDLRLLGKAGLADEVALREALRAQRLRLRQLQLDALTAQRRRVEALLVVACDALTTVYGSPDLTK